MSPIIQFPTGKVKNRKKSIQNPVLDIKNNGSCICKNPDCQSTNIRISQGSGIHALRGDCQDCGKFFWVDKKIAERLIGGGESHE